ncbi:MAG TPA: hypothetical protein VGN75_03490 [Kaistia sp.]|nr:hypothetical protein [Kaistia sp.]
MPDNFDLRWVMISDYSSQDETGKLVLAGVYAEDIVFAGPPPAIMPRVVATLCIAPKVPKFNVEYALIREDGEPFMKVTGALEGDGEVGRRDRAILRIPFPEGPFPGAGTYLILLGDGPDHLVEAHRFEMSVTPQ